MVGSAEDCREASPQASPRDHTPSNHETPAAACTDARRPQHLHLHQPHWPPYLHDANFQVHLLGIRGERPFLPVHPACFMLDLATRCYASPLAVAFGASYFQRVMEETGNPRVARFFGGAGDDGAPTFMCAHAATALDVELLLTYAACVSLATKNFDGQYSHPPLQLTRMLEYILDKQIHKTLGLQFEQRCLVILDHRLGPRLF